MKQAPNVHNLQSGVVSANNIITGLLQQKEAA